MKLICNQSDLSAHLAIANRAVPSRPMLPILANVLLTLDADAQTASLTAFDTTLGLRTTFPAQVAEAGTCALPARLLNDLVSRLPVGELTLTCEADADDEENITATLVHVSGRYQLRGTAEKFPALPVATGDPVDLDVELLEAGLGATLFAASTDESKQVLTGVHLTHPDGSLEFAATDGHRLAVMQGPPAAAIADLDVTIPARALRELERLLGNCEPDTPVQFRCDDKQVAFDIGDCHLTSRKLEGAYPAYRQLLPTQFARQVTVDRKRLQEGLELTSVLADQRNNIVKFRLDSENQQLALSVDAPDVGNARESLPAQIAGESMEIAFNARYLTEGLKALRASEVQLQLNEPTQPVVLTPLGEQKLTYLVMPVQLRN